MGILGSFQLAEPTSELAVACKFARLLRISTPKSERSSEASFRGEKKEMFE